MNRIRRLLIASMLMLFARTPYTCADIGVGSCITSALAGVMYAGHTAYQSLKRDHRKYAQRKKAQHDARVADGKETQDDVEPVAPFSFRHNIGAALKRISLNDIAVGTVGSLVGLYALDQLISFDSINIKVDGRTGNLGRTVLSNIAFCAKKIVSVCASAPQIAVSRMQDLMPELHMDSAMRALPAAALIAGARTMYDAYQRAAANAHMKKEDFSLMQNVPDILAQSNKWMFGRWFVANAFLLHWLDQFAKQEKRARQATEHPTCPTGDSVGRRAYIRAYATFGRRDWAQEAATNATRNASGDDLVTPVTNQMDRLHERYAQQKKCAYIQKNYQKIIQAADSAFGTKFIQELRNAQYDNKQRLDDFENREQRELQAYYRHDYASNDAHFRVYAAGVLNTLGVHRNLHKALIDAAAGVAHCAAVHCSRGSRIAGERAIESLFAGKSAACAVGYAVIASAGTPMEVAMGFW